MSIPIFLLALCACAFAVPDTSISRAHEMVKSGVDIQHYRQQYRNVISTLDMISKNLALPAGNIDILTEPKAHYVILMSVLFNTSRLLASSSSVTYDNAYHKSLQLLVPGAWTYPKAFALVLNLAIQLGHHDIEKLSDIIVEDCKDIDTDPLCNALVALEIESSNNKWALLSEAYNLEQLSLFSDEYKKYNAEFNREAAAFRELTYLFNKNTQEKLKNLVYKLRSVIIATEKSMSVLTQAN